MDLYARLNILGGHSVRLPRGDLADAIRLDNDPVSRARSWAAQGADIIHVVDLDAAAHRDYQNRSLIDDIISAVPIPVQVAGGIRSPKEATRLIEAGAHRVVMGTAAIEDRNMVWDLCREYPSKIVVSIDVRPDEEIAIRGWAMNSGRYLEEVLLEMSDAGVTSFLIAEAGRNALLEPPNLDILKTTLSLVDDGVIASGGVRHLDDLRQLAATGADGKRIEGVIVGREVTHGRFTLDEAKKVLAEAPPLVSTGQTSSEDETEVSQAGPVMTVLADHYRRMANELDRAAAHARSAQRRVMEGESARGHTHGLTSIGHLRKAQRLADGLTETLAESRME